MTRRRAIPKIEPFYENTFYKELGLRIKSLRVMNGYNQNAIASFIGVTFQQVQKYESGANRIPIIQLVRLANLFSEGLPGLLPDVCSPDKPGRIPTSDLELLRALHVIPYAAPIREMILKLGKAG
jgi:transcriptional regulator with XRE-family HTH domain